MKKRTQPIICGTWLITLLLLLAACGRGRSNDRPTATPTQPPPTAIPAAPTVQQPSEQPRGQQKPTVAATATSAAATNTTMPPVAQPTAASAPTPSAPTEVTTLYVMDGAHLSTLDFGSQIAFQALQGIVNQQSASIFLNNNNEPAHDENWVAMLSEGYGVPVVREDNLAWYLTNFAPSLQGIIQYDSAARDSVNVALSLAGVLRALPVDVNDQELVNAVAALNLATLEDVSGYDETWLRQSEYWPRFNQSGIIQLHPYAGLPNLRDFGVAQQMPFFYNDTSESGNLDHMETMIDSFDGGSLVYGWGYTDRRVQESTFVGTATLADLGTVPSDLAGNLSVYMHFPTQMPMQREIPPLPTATDRHYVAFVISDGDNVQYALNHLTHPGYGLYADEHRGQVPVGWTLPPALKDVAPPILDFLYYIATPNDAFLAGPSGWTYVFPSQIEPATWGPKTIAALEQVGMTSFVSLDYAKTNGFSAEVLGPALDAPSMAGAFFVAYDWSDPPAGSVVWAHGKPIFPTLRLGYENPGADEIDRIASVINERTRDATSPAGYTVVYAHAWTTTVTDLYNLMQLLDEGVEVVRPDVLLLLAQQNIPHD